MITVIPSARYSGFSALSVSEFYETLSKAVQTEWFISVRSNGIFKTESETLLPEYVGKYDRETYSIYKADGIVAMGITTGLPPQIKGTFVPVGLGVHVSCQIGQPKFKSYMAWILVIPSFWFFIAGVVSAFSLSIHDYGPWVATTLLFSVSAIFFFLPYYVNMVVGVRQVQHNAKMFADSFRIKWDEKVAH